ncbi:MAG: hypothetical protein ACPLVI_00855 [Thermoplasmata archaeon]|jgi:CHASE2 domain-containing sensor protein|nr:hypothetical protein [Thermoplasmatales archaeon]PMP75156.1 MAG: hypothetical protein C0180_02110 [Aciduliprofundum sp.]
MLDEIAAGIVIVLSAFFLYVSLISWRNMKERKYIFLAFIFIVFLLKGISYFFFTADYLYPSLDAIILVFLYLVIVSR